MAFPTKFRKWHFLLLGGLLILLSAFLWYWNWRILGIPSPLQPEHFSTIASFVVGLFVLCVFIYRLNRAQVTIMLGGMVLVNLLAAMITLWIYRTYPALFEWVCPGGLTAYAPLFVEEWQTYFLTPALYALHIGLLLLWGVSLVMFLIRKTTDEPE